MKSALKISLLLLYSFLAFSTLSLCQEELSKHELKLQKKNFLLKDRPWTIEIPLWIPGFAGDLSYGEISLEGEDGGDPSDPGDPDDNEKPNWLERIFSEEWYLKFFFLSRFAYEKGKFLAQLDGIAGAMGYNVKFNYNNKDIVKANFRTVNVRLFAGYKLLELNSKSKKFRFSLHPYIGVRSHFQRVWSDLDGIANRLDIHPYWIEPIIGIRNEFTLKRWKFIAMIDYGGYFVSNKWSNQISLLAYYRSGSYTSIKLGWNILQLNHLGTIAQEELRLKVLLTGPSAGVAFHF